MSENNETTESASTVIVENNDVLERLRNELRKAQPFPNGTVVRFTSVDARTGDHYHYAALFTTGHWWFTGQGNSYFPKAATQAEFSALLMANGHRITGLQLATKFEDVEI